MAELVEQLSEIMKGLSFDPRVEAVIADIVDRGVNSDSVLISPKGLFKRKFSRDIEQVTTLDISKKQKYTVVEINREGIYDALPQAITHCAKRNKKGGKKTGSDMADEVRKRRTEENAARAFFLPFENEFHQLGVSIEMEERNILNGFFNGSSRATALINTFWQLPSILDSRQKAIFIHLIPIIYKVPGDLELTKLCYEAILDTKVNFIPKYGRQQNIEGIAPADEGDLMLGANFSCGNVFYDYTPYFEIEIGPLNDIQLPEYLPGGKGNEVIAFLNGYFLPFDTETELKINIDPDKKEFVFGNTNLRLGYTSCL